MANLLSLLSRAEAAGFYLEGDVLKARRGVDAALLAEVRADRERVAAGLRVWADVDALSDECDADPIVRRWTRLMALSTLLDGDDEIAVLAEAEAVLGIPAAQRTPLVGLALRLGATVVGEPELETGE
jgi:hypothetical protein